MNKILLLFVFFLLAGCKGAYISGYSLEPDTSYQYSTIFNVIYDQDSTFHWYVHLYEGEIWCYYHSRYEMLRKL